MKKALSLFLVTALLCGCTRVTKPDPADASQTTTASAAEPEKTTATAVATTTGAESTTEIATTTAEEKTDIKGLPEMDGSTSAIPLEAGLKSELLGISYTEAKELVKHTKTHESFQRLLSGEIDLIFSVPISDEQQKMADEAGKTLVTVPVAKEGFVFVVNADNPITELSTQQIKDIYSGKITNWKELGGKDLPILAYQRNTDSGSQNYMVDFMGDTPLKEPESKYVEGEMGGLMDAIAAYDNSEGAIGYSVYSYAAQMYANANKVKFIAVDGIAPTKATMADESYPLSSCTYIIYTDDADDKTVEFTEWAASDEGQLTVLKSGYLPVNGMEIPEEYLPYEAKGTGVPKAADYAPDPEYSVFFPWFKDGYSLTNGISETENYYRLDFLKNTELQDRINADIIEATKSLKPYFDEKYLSREYSNGELLTISGGVSMDVCCKNGYLSLLLGYRRTDEESGYYDYYYSGFDYAVSLNYDLFTGKRLDSISDLFYEGADFVPAVNNAISDYISTRYIPDTNADRKIDFSGLLGSPEVFTIESVWLPPDSPYFYDSANLFYIYDDSIYDLSPVGKYRDMSELIDEKYIDSLEKYRFRQWPTDHFVENGVYIPIVKSSRFHTDEEIKNLNDLYYKAYTKAAEIFKNEFDYDFSANDWPSRLRMHKLGGAYCLTIGIVEPDFTAWLDAETLEPLSVSDILGENWKKDLPECDTYCLCSYSADENQVTAWVMYGNDNMYDWKEISVPIDEVNMKYIGEYESFY